MKTKTKQASSFLFLYLISTSFYANRILTRFIFQNAGKWGWIIIWIIALFLILASIPIYRLIQKIKGANLSTIYQKKPLTSIVLRILMYFYLFLTSFLCLSFLVTLTNSGWLLKSSFLMILVPLLFVIYYVLSHPIKVLLRLSTLFIYPIIIQSFVFVFAKNKAFDLYAIIPNVGKGPMHPLLASIAGIGMVLDLGLCLFYFQECKEKIKKGPYAFVIFFHIFSLAFDSLIATGQFGSLISQMPFAYYESWRIINFGQYIVYLDTFAFFYWVTSAFCRLAIAFYLIKKIDTQKQYIYRLSYLLLGIFVIYVLNHATLYTTLRAPTLCLSTFIFFICLVIHINTIRKVGKV